MVHSPGLRTRQRLKESWMAAQGIECDSPIDVSYRSVLPGYSAKPFRRRPVVPNKGIQIIRNKGRLKLVYMYILSYPYLMM